MEKFLSYILRLNVLLFPFLWITFVGLIILEAYTFRGFIKQIFLVPLLLIFLLLAISGFLASGTVRTLDRKIEILKIYLQLKEINNMVLVILIVLAGIFLSLERVNYRGFVANNFKFEPTYFLHLISISLLLMFIKIKDSQIKLNRKLMSIRLVMAGILLVILPLLLYKNVLVTVENLRPTLKTIIKNPFADNRWKYNYLYMDTYDYFEFVNKNTPEDALILRMPQQSQWPEISNDGFVRRFIYPRKTKVYKDDNSLRDLAVHYIFIHRAYEFRRDGKQINKWPDFYIPAEYVIYVKDNDPYLEPIKINGDYDPNLVEYQEAWGLIKLRR